MRKYVYEDLADRDEVGNGNPNCPKCHGRGVLDGPLDSRGLPSVIRCDCVLIKELIQNVNKGWKNLYRAKKVKSSPLIKQVEKDLWFTASRNVARSHVRYVALRQGPHWNFKVVSDADLMTAWLGSTVLQRKDIYDPDVASQFASVSLGYHALEDLIDPPDLLIIQLGVKSARNSAMAEVLVETLERREYVDKPTWVFDQPEHPFNDAHLCYSPTSATILNSFERIDLKREGKRTAAVQKQKKRTGSPRISISAIAGVDVGGTSSTEAPIPKEPTKKRYK